LIRGVWTLGSLRVLAKLPTTMFPALGNLAKELLCFLSISHNIVNNSVILLLLAFICVTSSICLFAGVPCLNVFYLLYTKTTLGVVFCNSCFSKFEFCLTTSTISFTIGMQEEGMISLDMMYSPKIIAAGSR